ncbi:hypothetical protein BJ968_000986 [Kineococcus aurantiacus]|uniref:Uncharacterized protein n=1 Tax=Kineococcus aurantiacus TaxID=37633 RepID=A0A7Y9DHJ4_9ACTN|nr:hypothetical protein [Kineococcus aurantiacus]
MSLSTADPQRYRDAASGVPVAHLAPPGPVVDPDPR